MGVLEDLYALYLDNPNNAIPRAGWCPKKVAFEIVINKEGELVRCTSLANSELKTKFVEMLVPDIQRTSGVKPFFLVDNAQYIFGFDKKRGEKKHTCFTEIHKDILGDVDCIASEAFLKFIDKGMSVDDDPILDPLKEKGNDTALIAFKLDGSDDYLQEIPEIAEKWSEYWTSHLDGQESLCCISGKIEPQAPLFPLITGLYGGQSSGASLISFNSDAYISYNQKPKDKGFGMGAETAAGIGQALTYILKDKEHRAIIAGDTVAFWVDAEADEVGSIFNFFGINSSGKIIEDSKKLNRVKSQVEILRSGSKCFDNLNDVKFHILGVAPYQSRIALRFYETGSLGSLKSNIESFLNEVEMINVESKPLFVYLKELIPEGVSYDNEKNYLPANLVRASIVSIVKGRPLPRALYLKILDRMKADRGINSYHLGLRAALMREHINSAHRYDNNYSERKVGMALDKTNTNTGYLLGRLFAVLEKTQHDANGSNNATVRDRYMTAAATTPVKVFSALLNLNSHHIGKLSKDKAGLAIYMNNLIGEIIDQLDSQVGFPAHLSLEDQGNFYLGYYQQVQDLYRKKSEN